MPISPIFGIRGAWFVHGCWNLLKTPLEKMQNFRISKDMLKIQEKEVDSRAKQGRDYTLTDEEVLAVISGYAKQRRDSIEAYRLGGRAEMLAKEEAELAIVCEYLPQQLTKEELISIVTQAISESGATGPRDMGAVMKLVVSATKGRADGKVVSQLVRDQLSG